MKNNSKVPGKNRQRHKPVGKKNQDEGNEDNSKKSSYQREKIAVMTAPRPRG